MTSVDDLIAFLMARLDEDHDVAEGGETACWHVDYCDQDGPAFMDRFDPARVLREVEAKRQLLEQFRLRGDSARAVVVPATGGVWDDLVRMLALPYSDHPDCRKDWLP